MNPFSESAPVPMRSPWCFMGSICLHGWVLAWVALGPSLALEKSQSLYEREIQPHEKKIVWYTLAEKLPDVTPAASARIAGPPRAKTRFDQNIVAGPKDDGRAPQLILAPAPEIALAKTLPLPNIVALAPPPRITRPFIPPPPPDMPPPARAPVLPDAPKVAPAAASKSAGLEVKTPRIERPFTPPPAKRIVPGAPSPLPAAPELAAAPESKPLALDLKRPRIERDFTPPAPRKMDVGESLPLPDAPNVRPAAPNDSFKPLPPRKFVPPEKDTPAPARPASMEAPPSLPSSASPSADSSLVIAGLNPTESLEVPPPPGSVHAAFSGGPKPLAKGGEGASSKAILEVPSLSVQGGARNPQAPVLVARVSPTSPEALGAAMRLAHPDMTSTPGESPGEASRSFDVPDPRLAGRRVYTMAIQVANLTSYSGSWVVWFATREADIGNAAVELQAPLPLNMVSPKYDNSAILERVQGKVRLWAVIGKDGHVGDISLLQHVDARLDRNAEEALGKWIFRPALRNGRPVDVDAVFEVPFTLAPKPVR